MPAVLTLVCLSALAVGAFAWFRWMRRVRESDLLIDMLAANLSTLDSDDELLRMFEAWRREVVSTPYHPRRGGHEPDPR